MADFDMSWDRTQVVKDAAVVAVKDMLRTKVNKYQAPNWLQAADMIHEMESLWEGPTSLRLEKVLFRIAERWDQEQAEFWTTQHLEVSKSLKRLMDEIKQMRKLNLKGA